MRKNVAGQRVTAQLNNISDALPTTLGTTNVYSYVDGALVGSGTASHMANGVWSYTPTQAQTNGNHLVFTFDNSLSPNQSPQVYTISYDPHNLSSLGLSNLDAKSSDILADTNELQQNQSDWTTATGFATVNFSDTSIINAINSLNDLTASDIWTHANRELTSAGASGVTVSELQAELNKLNDFDPTTEQVVASNMMGTNGAITSLQPVLDAISSLPTVSDIWETQLTESYANNGSQMTASQAMHMIWSDLRSPAQSGNVWNDYRLDNNTISMSFSLDSETEPTKKTRVS